MARIGAAGGAAVAMMATLMLANAVTVGVRARRLQRQREQLQCVGLLMRAVPHGVALGAMQLQHRQILHMRVAGAQGGASPPR